jgi:hypothetical protein
MDIIADKETDTVIISNSSQGGCIIPEGFRPVCFGPSACHRIIGDFGFSAIALFMFKAAEALFIFNPLRQAVIWRQTLTPSPA